MKGHRTADHPDSADQFVRHSTRVADRHVILYFAHAILVQEAGDEDGSVRPVELLVPEVVTGRSNAETPALAAVQQPGEDARRIEVRQAEPVDGAVHPDQRGRAHVADDPVILDWLVARSHFKVLLCWHSDPSTWAQIAFSSCRVSHQGVSVFMLPLRGS